MSCKICGRGACCASFHSIEEQELHDLREAMPDDVPLLRRMVQEGAAEILELKASLASQTLITEDWINIANSGANKLNATVRELDAERSRRVLVEAAVTACHSAMLGNFNPSHPAWGVLFAAQDIRRSAGVKRP